VYPSIYSLPSIHHNHTLIFYPSRAVSKDAHGHFDQQRHKLPWQSLQVRCLRTRLTICSAAALPPRAPRSSNSPIYSLVCGSSRDTPCKAFKALSILRGWSRSSLFLLNGQIFLHLLKVERLFLITCRLASHFSHLRLLWVMTYICASKNVLLVINSKRRCRRDLMAQFNDFD
jgi:hypothetical protein